MSGLTQPPGWYPAQGDPPGTVRWWDGEKWVGGPQQQGAQQQAGYVAPGAGMLANGREVADPWLRIAAKVIDFVITFIISIPVGLAFGLGSAFTDVLSGGGDSVDLGTTVGVGIAIGLLNALYFPNGVAVASIPRAYSTSESKTETTPYSCVVSSIDYELKSIPPLDRPIFVMAFKGLFDMGEAATGAVDWLSMTHNGKPAAAIDPELLFDFQETRPTVQLGANGVREIHWPTNNVVWAQTPEGDRDLVLLSGIEPHLRWRSFCRTLIEIMEATGTELVVTLGSALAMVPHTRAFPVTASTGEPELAATLGIDQPSYEGPTGLVGSLHQELADHDVATMSLRVSIPHYVPGNPSPKATAALLANLQQICGVKTAHAGLADDIRDWESRVHRVLDDDEDVKAYVQDLEQKADSEPEIVYDDEGSMADEIEMFLRNRADEN